MTPPDEMPTLAGLRRGRSPKPARPPKSSRPTTSDTLSLFGTPVSVVSPSPVELRPEPLPAPLPEPPAQPPPSPISQPSAALLPPRRAPRAEPRVWTVAELVGGVRGLLEDSFGSVAVEGEISNWRPAGSGHCYFTLKDGDAQVSAVMFRKQTALLRFKPKDGDAVRLRGQLSVYENRGQLQIIAERMEQVGLGALLAAVRELKERLRREGLFDRQRPLPAFPRCIGIVTSAHGAALRDIVKVCRRRHAAVNLLVYKAAVQGPDCARQVAAGVRWFSARAGSGGLGEVDVVLVARGGGSWEDLHGFDDEAVARAIAACAVPVVTGIGHATDTTIADAAADLCAPTPSAAAELVTAAQHRVEARIAQLSSRLERAGRYEVLRSRQRLSSLNAAAALTRVRDGLGRRAQALDELGFRAEAALRRRLRSAAMTFNGADTSLRAHHPALRLAGDRARGEALSLRLAAARGSLLAERRARLERAASRLGALSPLRVLERGYALVYGAEGHLLHSAEGVADGESLSVRLARGRLQAVVTGRE